MHHYIATQERGYIANLINLLIFKELVVLAQKMLYVIQEIDKNIVD